MVKEIYFRKGKGMGNCLSCPSFRIQENLYHCCFDRNNYSVSKRSGLVYLVVLRVTQVMLVDGFEEIAKVIQTPEMKTLKTFFS